MSDQAAASDKTKLERAMDTLRGEIDMLTKGGIIEVAVRNPSVVEYMNHWEGRALKAEAALDEARAALEPFANASRIELEGKTRIVYVTLGDLRRARAALLGTDKNTSPSLGVSEEGEAA